MDEFVDKVTLITGAGRGIGREIALAFASLGAAVAANDINPLNLDETINMILQAKGKGKSFVFDIAKRMPIEAMLAQVLEHFGRIEILVNHASVQPDASLLEMDEWEFHRTLDVNLGGPFFTIQQVGRSMRECGGGSIVNLISTGGWERFHKGHAAHLASQAGLVGLTQAAASELAIHHIRVNAICHGPPIFGAVAESKRAVDKFHAWHEAHPDLWLGEHPDLVCMVLYLCSPESESVNGQVFTVDIGK